MRRHILFLVFALTAVRTTGQVQLTVSDVNAEAGFQAVVPIAISEGANISALQLVVNFDATSLSISENSILSGDALGDHSVGTNIDGGTLRVVIFSSSLSTFMTGPKTVIRIIFDVDEAANSGENLALTLSEVETSDPDGQPVALDTVDGSITVSAEGNTPEAGENELAFAQMANGAFAAGNFRVAIVAVNLTKAVAGAQVDFSKSSGEPFVVSLTDGQVGSTFSFEVPAGGSAFLETDGTGELSPGYARLSATAPLGGTLTYTVRDPDGVVTAEAGVGASQISEHLSVPVIFVDGVTDTGIALANLSSVSVDVILILKDANGQELARDDGLTLGAGNHSARFASGIFQSLVKMGQFKGSIEVLASSPIAAITIKQQGLLLTTLPVLILR